jgi:hypothetical protein
MTIHKMERGRCRASVMLVTFNGGGNARSLDFARDDKVTEHDATLCEAGATLLCIARTWTVCDSVTVGYELGPWSPRSG